MGDKFSEAVFYVYISPIISVFGIIGNILNLLTLRRKSLKDSPYTYLIALAIAELVDLTIMIGFSFVRCDSCMRNELEDYVAMVYEYFIYQAIGSIAVYSASYIIFAMTVERFIFVRFPFSAKKLCTKKNARISIIFVFFIAVIVNFPRFFLYTVHFSSTTSCFSAYTVVECSFWFDNPNLTSNVSFLTPSCMLSRLSNFNSTKFSLDLVMQDRLTEIGYHVVDTSETFNEFLDSLLIGIKNVEYGKCFDGFDGNNDISGDKLLPFVNWSELTQWQKLKIESFRFLVSFNSTFINLFKKFNFEIKPASNSSALTNSPSSPFTTAFFQYRASNYSSVYEIYLFLDISKSEKSIETIKKIPCFQECQLQQFHSPENIIYNSSAIVRKTSFYEFSHQVYFYIFLILNISVVVVTGIINLFIIKFLHRTTQSSKKLFANNYPAKNKQFQTQRRLTLTLVIASSLAVITTCFGIFIFDPVSKAVFGDNFRENENYLLIGVITNFLVSINSSNDFVLYALFNTQYKKEFLVVIAPIISFFCCCYKVLNSKLKSSENVGSNINSSGDKVVDVSKMSTDL